MRSHVLHGSDDVIFFLDLIHELSLSRFDFSIHNSFDFLILIVDGLSLCTINEYELLSNALEQFFSTIAKLLDFFLLADTCTLRFNQLFGSLKVDPSIYSVGRLNQFRSRRYILVCGLNVVSDHAG